MQYQIAMCSAVDVAVEPGRVPEWVHLLPAGEIRTIDGRGPYRIASMQTIASQLTAGDKLPIDENHATDKGGQKLGMPAPARGWIVALQVRDSGLWGKVEWTGEGRRLMSDKAYSGISPVILHSRSGEIVQLLRASLTNIPNFKGLTSLHSQGRNTTARQKPLDDDDRLIMAMMGISEEDYRAGQARVGLAQSHGGKFTADDRKMMAMFGMNEAQWSEHLKANGLMKAH